MNDKSPEDRDDFRRMIERGRAARKQMQEILDRVAARQLERQKRAKR